VYHKSTKFIFKKEDKVEGSKRREQLFQLLKERTEPISGGELSRLLGVSRQVIVQDIALLRASDINVISTTKGYLIYHTNSPRIKRIFKVKHTTEQIEDELCTIVDNGGKILDVIVEHPVYGEICANLMLASRRDLEEFLEKLATSKAEPLSLLTGGVHLHTIEVPSDETFSNIKQQLRMAGILMK
jgi:transcriptional regulator of NAD metabolism